ncbi:adhesion G-protein coupled receptor G6-like [Patiria miniata]|uniref:G-protein coupled receptors family 2 profile 2 domain-containing protein n=1 Tax=Patiria miniata TaxID=46514 RepID=A0A913YYY4_PATMI|nr:adhesion G-protein coupled receptor G6-like [Patiria miniata]
MKMAGLIRIALLLLGLCAHNSALAIPNTTHTPTSTTQSSELTASANNGTISLIPAVGQLMSDLEDILANLNLTVPLPVNVSEECDLPTIAPPEEIERVRSENEGLPIECRKDVCFQSFTNDLKGNFTWGDTLAGDYAFSHCPNGVRRPYNTSGDRPLAYRACKPPATCRHILPKPRFPCSEHSYWGDVNTTFCRWNSDITNELEDILFDLIELLQKMVDEREANVTSVITLLQQTNKILSPTDQLTVEDVSLTASIMDLCVTSGVDDVLPLRSDLGEELVAMADNILKMEGKILETVHTACTSIAKSLQNYAAHVKLPVISRSVKHSFSNIVLEINEPSRDLFSLPIEFNFFMPESQAETVATIKFPYFLLSGLIRDADPTSNNDTEPIQLQNIPVPVVRTSATVYYNSKFFTGDLSIEIPVEDTVLLYAKVYSDGVEVKQLQEPFSVTFYHPQMDDDQLPSDDFQCGAARLSRDESERWNFIDRVHKVKLEWDSSACTLNYTDANQTDCICKVLDLLGLIQDLIPAPTQPQTTQEVPQDLFGFLNFPYYVTLTALCYIGYYISLISLVLVIATYAVFPRVRRGRPTLILINLCISIVLLIIVLVTSTLYSNTLIGCRIANSLRLYFILVSLMWNGVEAVHMYIALVRVFSSPIRHFVIKCGVVAWGLPGILIGVPLAFNFEIYDGTYKDCDFVCQLSAEAFSFVFLTPMIAIVTCNSIVFVMVLWIICKMYARDERRSLLTQLMGAVALLVLLGISWGFGASAAITYTQPDEDTVSVGYFILQTLFVLSVAFQGFFIFIFHCVRYHDIRKQWLKTFRPCCKVCRCSRCTSRTKDVDRVLVPVSTPMATPMTSPMTSPVTSPMSSPDPSVGDEVDNVGLELDVHDEDTHL